MTDKLKAAIITIAEYEPMFGAWTVDAVIKKQKYTTSADALLPVWRKVRNECFQQKYGMRFILDNTAIEDSGQQILDDNLPGACELIADIINDLKQK